jgi:hypothetical protein
MTEHLSGKAALRQFGGPSGLLEAMSRPERRRRSVIYVHDDGVLKRRIAEATDAVRTKTGERVTEGAIVRRLLHAALESPRARRKAGIPA